jgi:hypothetical protein
LVPAAAQTMAGLIRPNASSAVLRATARPFEEHDGGAFLLVLVSSMVLVPGRLARFGDSRLLALPACGFPDSDEDSD